MSEPWIEARNYDEEAEDWLESLPKCSCCKEPIQDEEYIEVDGECYCNECELAESYALWCKFSREDYLVKG